MARDVSEIAKVRVRLCPVGSIGCVVLEDDWLGSHFFSLTHFSVKNLNSESIQEWNDQKVAVSFKVERTKGIIGTIG